MVERVGSDALQTVLDGDLVGVLMIGLNSNLMGAQLLHRGSISVERAVPALLRFRTNGTHAVLVREASMISSEALDGGLGDLLLEVRRQVCVDFIRRHRRRLLK